MNLHTKMDLTLFTLLVGLFLIYLQHQTVLVSKKAHYSDTYHQLSRSFSLFSLILLGIFLQLTYHFIIFSNFSRFLPHSCINLMCHFTLSNTFVFNIPHFNHNLPLHTIYFVIMNMKGRFLCDESD